MSREDTDIQGDGHVMMEAEMGYYVHKPRDARDRQHHWIWVRPGKDAPLEPRKGPALPTPSRVAGGEETPVASVLPCVSKPSHWIRAHLNPVGPHFTILMTSAKTLFPVGRHEFGGGHYSPQDTI